MNRKKGDEDYETLAEEEYYRIDKGRGVVRVSKDKETNNKTVLFSKEVLDKNNTWKHRKGYGISFSWIGKIIDILIKFAGRFGWKVSALEKPEKQVQDLKQQLDQAIKQKYEMQRANEKLEVDIKSYSELLLSLRENVVKENLDKFQRDLQEFEDLLKKSESENVKEEELQKFLKERTWIFSPEYNNIEPKKPAGSKGIFDFYLEDYKGQGTVIELEKPSDDIFSRNERYGLSSKCGEALGQLIRYCEDTISIAHSGERKEIERIYEIRPVGYLIIGRTKNSDDNKRLKIMNSYLHFVEVLSYDQLLARAKTFVEPWLNKHEAETKTN